PEVRDAIANILADAQRRLLTELGPIFEAFRTGARRNLVLLPLCAMPHPASVESGMKVATAARDLARSIAKTPPRERAIPQLFLVEDVAEFSVLSEADLAQCVRNFLTLLLYSLSAVERVSALLYGDQPGEPLATFVCAVCELPRKALCTWAVDGIALEVLDAVLAEREDDVSLAALDALEDVELAAFDEPKDADRDVLALLERYAPPQARDPEPAWWERAETLRARYGPDPGDPSSDDEQPPPHPPVGWALSVMREIETTWRTLQRRRFDDLIAQERDEVQRRRDVLLGAVEQKVDQTLWRDPAPESFRRAAALARQMERAVSLRLEDAIRDRDAARPVPPPSFDHFRAAHAAYLDAARRKPDLARMIVYGLLFVTAFTIFLPLPLRNLAEALRI
ncbi:MAG: hypothetical protein K8H88_00800, partial [Sandaracinaceae bacterium]|nr:hypothetical protein [Sandaracinaceae bacterium]